MRIACPGSEDPGRPRSPRSPAPARPRSRGWRPAPRRGCGRAPAAPPVVGLLPVEHAAVAELGERAVGEAVVLQLGFLRADRPARSPAAIAATAAGARSTKLTFQLAIFMRGILVDATRRRSADDQVEQPLGHRAAWSPPVMRALPEHRQLLAHRIEAGACVVGAHAAGADAAERQVADREVEQGVVDRDPAGQRARMRSTVARSWLKGHSASGRSCALTWAMARRACGTTSPGSSGPKISSCITVGVVAGSSSTVGGITRATGSARPGQREGFDTRAARRRGSPAGVRTGRR